MHIFQANEHSKSTFWRRITQSYVREMTQSRIPIKERIQSRISIWRKDSKSYLQISFHLVLEKGLKVVSPDNFTFWLPAEAKSQLFFGMLIRCRSKVTFILALDPLQKQGLGHSLVFDSLQKQSHNHSFICWSPAEARSHLFFWRLIPCKSKILPIFYFLFVCERTQSRIHTLLFSMWWCVTLSAWARSRSHSYCFSLWRYVTLSAWPRSRPHSYYFSLCVTLSA